MQATGAAGQHEIVPDRVVVISSIRVAKVFKCMWRVTEKLGTYRQIPLSK
jgi:hypothetical protein